MVKALMPLAAAIVLILGTLVLITDCEEPETRTTEGVLPSDKLSELQEDFLDFSDTYVRDTPVDREELEAAFSDILATQPVSVPKITPEERVRRHGLPVAVFKRMDLLDLPDTVLTELSRISHTCEARIGELDTSDMNSYDARVFQVQLEHAREKDICVSQFTHLEAPFASRLTEFDRIPR